MCLSFYFTIFPILSHSSILKTNLIKRSLCLTASYVLKMFDYDCIKEQICILGVSNIQFTNIFKSKLNFGFWRLGGKRWRGGEGWRYFKYFKSNSCGLKFDRIDSTHTYLNFIWNLKLVKEYWTNLNMPNKRKRKVLDISREILNHEENCSGKTDEIALSCVCVWLWHRQYYNSESFRIQFQRKNAFNTFSLHSQFHP